MDHTHWGRPASPTSLSASSSTSLPTPQDHPAAHGPSFASALARFLLGFGAMLAVALLLAWAGMAP